MAVRITIFWGVYNSGGKGWCEGSDRKMTDSSGERIGILSLLLHGYDNILWLLMLFGLSNNLLLLLCNAHSSNLLLRLLHGNSKNKCYHIYPIAMATVCCICCCSIAMLTACCCCTCSKPMATTYWHSCCHMVLTTFCYFVSSMAITMFFFVIQWSQKQSVILVAPCPW